MSSLHSALLERQRSHTPIRIGLIGAGKFGSMFLSQVHRTPGMHLVAIADLDPNRAISTLQRVNFPSHAWSSDLSAQCSVSDAVAKGSTTVTKSSDLLFEAAGIDVVIECTGNPAAGVRHALLACEHKKHIVMVNVEADVLVGPLLARKAQEAGIVYSMAYGDQPALIAEVVDWARTAGFKVVCAGKGTKHLPEYHYSTPDTVWQFYGLGPEEVKDLNPQMFNSFLDGTKSAIEMAAVANACGLTPPKDGLRFPPCGAHDLPKVLKPKGGGGILEEEGTVEVVSCLEIDGRNVHNDLRWGVYVVIEAADEYQRSCFKQYGFLTDQSGWYAAQYKPYHMIGLELGISVASIAVRGGPTGQCRTWSADVVATAKKDLKAGQRLDGEGGYTVYGKLMTVKDSMAMEGLPIGLAHGVTLKKDIGKDKPLSWQDVEYDAEAQVVTVRREMERMFRDGELAVEDALKDA